MKCKDVKPGMVFKYANADKNGLLAQAQFIKLQEHRLNVVNVATWTAATVDPDEEVIVLFNLVVWPTARRMP